MDTLIKIFLNEIRKLKTYTDAWSVNHTIFLTCTFLSSILTTSMIGTIECVALEVTAKEANTLLNSITEQIYVNL